jgi:hypothetical protein
LGEAEPAATPVLRLDFQMPQRNLGVCFFTLRFVANIAEW